MARKEIDLKIDDEGRDKGKVFHLTEMPAYQAEEWAIKALLAINRAHAELGLEPALGMAAFGGLGANAINLLLGVTMSFGDAKALLDEMLACVQIKPDHKNPNIVRPLLPEDIEEVGTIFKLRKEVLKLHVGFSHPGSALK